MKNYYFWFFIPLLFCSELLAQKVAYKDTVFTNYFRRTGPGWIASDATLSLPLPNGKVLWFFGDTYLDDYVADDNSIPCLFQVRNSILIQDTSKPDKFTLVIDSTQSGMERTPVKLPDDTSSVFWPGSGFVKGDTAYLFWFRYHGKTYEFLGNYYFKIHWPTFKSAADLGDLIAMPISNSIEYGNSVVIDSASNYVYLYGFARGGTEMHNLHVARFPWNKIFKNWEYYDGKKWTSDASTAKSISTEAFNPSFSVLRIKNKYYAFSQELGYLTCGYGRNIYSLESSTPFGPFINKNILYTIEDKFRNSYMITYNGTAHPEFTRNNELLFSYNVNDICPKQCNDGINGRWDADTYRPKFIRIPLALIDPAFKESGVKK